MVKAARPRPRIRPSLAERGGDKGGGGGESGGRIGSTSERPAPVQPRIGRPTVQDKRKKAIRVLTTEDEHAELTQAAADVSMSVSTWMRALALERARQMAKKTRQEERQGERSRQDDEQEQ